MTVDDRDGRARKFEHIAGTSSYLGRVQVVSSFPNPQNFLRPGQFGRLRAAPGARHGALLVPQKAVSELQGTYQLAMVGADSKVTIRPAKVGERVGPLWIVGSGVKAGELVVVEGLQKVQNGATVKIKQPQAKGRLTHVQVFYQPAHRGHGHFGPLGDRRSGDDRGASSGGKSSVRHR